MKEIYDWVPWFGELAQKIAKRGEQYLIDTAKRVAWRDDDKEFPLLSNGDENIDPFSFFYSLARFGKASRKNKQRVYQSIESEFEMTRKLPVDCDDAFRFPIPPARVSLLFHDGETFKPRLLWRLFRSAVSGLDSVDAIDFEDALNIPNVAIAKLTQALFLINPTQFIPLDNRTRPLISDPSASNANLASYKEALEKFQDACPGCTLYEINLFAWYRQQKKVKTVGIEYFQVSTNVYDDRKDHWEDFNSNNWVYTGGPGKESWDEYKPGSGGYKYPVEDPQSGDIVLVRFGSQNGRGIGVIYRNDYGPEYRNDIRMHVIWVNKKSVKIDGGRLSGFSKARGPTKSAFSQVEAYAPTFELLDRLDRQGKPAEDQSRGGPPVETEHPRNRILYGPPGTGKTWNTVNHALAIIDGAPVQPDVDRTRFHALREAGQIEMVTFHQNFAYEDFIEGIRPKLAEGKSLEYELKTGIFKRLADAAEQEPDKPFVLIIDEINRGNIAKIFGELITLIEDSRRTGGEDATRIKLPYSGEDFGVPDNLYIIGAMNTADRGIQLLDTALRRRFTFIETMPDPEHEGICGDIQGVNCGEMLKVMNERITALFDREHQIGHTYLLRVADMEGLSIVFQNQIFPLLQEYFFDDWKKIDEVLGKNGFVKQRSTEGLFHDGDQAEDRTIFERLTDGDPAWKSPESYQRIYASRTTQEMSADA